MITANNHHPRPRVLLMAYACSPQRGSEGGVGWNRALQAAKHFDTWVICKQRGFSEEIRSHLEAHGDVPGLKFEFVPKMPWEEALGRIPGLYYLSYNLWHRRAYRLARRLHDEIHFDLVHQVNYCGYREPGYLWKLDVPFVWGPIGGTQNYPWRFLGEAGIGGAFSEALRSVANVVQLRFSPRVRRAARKAAALLAANSTNQSDFIRAHHVTPIVASDTGIRCVADAPRACPSTRKKLRILWSGHFQPFKALPLLIKALARLPDGIEYELRVLGDGSLKNRWQRLARRTDVERHTQWMGWLPHHQALQQYAWADVFVFSSLRDTTGTVVLEALGAGLPVICFDHQGVRDVVTDRCGIKLPVTTPRQAIDRLRDAVSTLANDTRRREELSRGALQRANEYLWDRHGEKMTAVYQRVLGNQCSLVEELSPARQQAVSTREESLVGREGLPGGTS